jgi:type IV secretory pathway VirB4 component
MQYLTKVMPSGSTPLEAWAEFRDQCARNDDRALFMLDDVNEERITKALKDPLYEKAIQDTAFAWFKKDEYPTHSQLQEMMFRMPTRLHNKEEVRKIATLLAPWCANGSYGKLFDGIGNVELTGKLAHIELGYIPESSKEMKELAGFLMNNYTRQHMIIMPRAAWKRKVGEEMARWLDVPGDEKIIEEEYAQLRKFNCWVVSIVQQYSKFRQSRIKGSVMGNSKQFFFLKQADQGDIDDICSDGVVQLSDTTKQAIGRYPLPEHLPVNNRYSSFTYYHVNDPKNICGTARNRVSKEMLYCSSSTGADFDVRARRLKQYDDVVDGIINEANGKKEGETK